MTSPRRFCAADATFVATVVFVAAICAFVGIASPLGSFADDAFFLLGNAYRVAGGQIPHVDFSSPWGPVMFLIEATGLHLSGMRPSGLGYANALFGSLIAIWAYLVARTRWSPGVACAAGIYTMLLIVAPFVIGGYPRDLSYAMVYNRYAYALLGIVLMECTGDMLSSDDRTQRTALAISTGAALGLLLFMKVSYAVVATAFICILPLAGSAGGARRFASMFGGFALVALLALSYLRFDLPDMLQDLAMAAHSRVLSLKPSSLLGVACLENAALLILPVLIRRYRAAFVALLTIAVGTVVLLTNQQTGGFPLDAYAALALLGTYLPSAGDVKRWPMGFALATALCVAPQCVESAVSLMTAALQWPPRPGAVTLAMPERGTSLKFAPFLGRIKTETAGVEYVEDLRDGMNILRAHLDKREGVLAFDQFNPFNYILNLPTPRGGFAAAAYNYIFDNDKHPSNERFFGDASYVLVPKYQKMAPDRYEEDGDTLALLRMYGRTLRARYAIIAETKHWVLWRRKITE